MATTESESSIDSPDRLTDPVQPTYAPGNNVMGQTVEISNREHENQSEEFPDIIPIPEVPRTGFSQVPRTQQQNLTQDTTSPLQADTSNHAHATQSAESLHTMPIPQLPRAGLRQIPGNQQNILAQGATQTGPSFISPTVASVQSIPFQGGSSSAPQGNRAEHVPSGWVYTPPGIEVGSPQYTSAQRPSSQKLPRLPSSSSDRFYPPTNVGSETGNHNNAVATRTDGLLPASSYQPTASPNPLSDDLPHPFTSMSAQSHVRQDAPVGITQRQISRRNISVPPSNHSSNSSDVLNQEAVPSLSYQTLISTERPPRGSQPNNPLLSRARTLDRTTSELSGPVPDSVDPRLIDNGVSAQSARSQSPQISAVASNHSSQSKVNRRERKRKRPWSALRISWPRLGIASDDVAPLEEIAKQEDAGQSRSSQD